MKKSGLSVGKPFLLKKKEEKKKKSYSSIETQCFGLMQGESRFCTSLDSIVHDDRKRG